MGSYSTISALPRHYCTTPNRTRKRHDGLFSNRSFSTLANDERRMQDMSEFTRSHVETADDLEAIGKRMSMTTAEKG